MICGMPQGGTLVLSFVLRQRKERRVTSRRSTSIRGSDVCSFSFVRQKSRCTREHRNTQILAGGIPPISKKCGSGKVNRKSAGGGCGTYIVIEAQKRALRKWECQPDVSSPVQGGDFNLVRCYFFSLDRKERTKEKIKTTKTMTEHFCAALKQIKYGKTCNNRETPDLFLHAPLEMFSSSFFPNVVREIRGGMDAIPDTPLGVCRKGII